MWELMELGLRCQRSAWEAQGRVIRAVTDATNTAKANAAAGEAMAKATEANLLAWDRWLKLWSGR